MGLDADAEATRTDTAAKSNDKIVLWEATGEMIHLWTTYENETYVYLDAFKQSSWEGSGALAMFDANSLTYGALKNTPFADVTKTYSYKAIYDPSQRTGSVPDEYKVAGTYPFTLGEKATDVSYTQSGKWNSEYDALYGPCMGTTSSGGISL